MPTLTVRKVATPSFTVNTPSVSFFLRAFVVSTGRFSVDTGLFSRTVRAMIGIDSACLRVSVTIRAVADKSDRHRQDRKSTRLNSSHTVISYAVFCLKKKKKNKTHK